MLALDLLAGRVLAAALAMACGAHTPGAGHRQCMPCWITLGCRLSHGEASVMDPQCRVLLEHTHLSLTDASSRSRQPVPLDTGV